MSPSDDSASRIQKKIQRHVSLLSQGILTPLEFCNSFFPELLRAIPHADSDRWKPCLDLLPHNGLQLLCEFADAGYAPISYELDPKDFFCTRFTSDAQASQVKSDLSIAMRQLHAELQQRLQSSTAAKDGPGFSLPTRLPGDPPLTYSGVPASTEPPVPDELAARMARYLQQADAKSREKFEAIRIAPEQMPLFDQRNLERVWVVARAGPQVLCYTHLFDHLDIGWILSTGKIWSVHAD